MLLLVLVACFGGSTGACSDGCVNQVVTEAASPNGSFRAVLFQRDCGATTGFSSQISVLTTGESLAGGGNVFVADDDHGASAVGSWGGPLVEMRWLGPRHLLVRYARQSRIFSQRETANGVTITFQEIRSP